MRVLVVEDDARLAEVLSSGLIAEGFDVDVADDGMVGYWHAREGAYDVLVLDIMLPFPQRLQGGGTAAPGRGVDAHPHVDRQGR